VPDPIVASETTAKVVRRNLSSTVLATGAIKPQIGAEVKVGARISGRVTGIVFVAVGIYYCLTHIYGVSLLT